jgi:hypothetical protein
LFIRKAGTALLLLVFDSFILLHKIPEELGNLSSLGDIYILFFLNGVNKGFGYCCKRGLFKEKSIGKL